MDIQLIPVTEADREFCKKVHHIAYRPVIDKMFEWDDKQQDVFVDSDFDHCNVHIIHYENHPAGAIGWQDKADHLWFGPLFLLPEHQCKGIGSFLLNQFIDKAYIQKRPIRLQTLRQNYKAKKLYEKLGFKVKSSCPIYWQMEHSKEESDIC